MGSEGEAEKRDRGEVGFQCIISLYFLFYYLTTYKPTGQEKENIHIAMYVLTGLLLATVIFGSQQYYLKQRKVRRRLCAVLGDVRPHCADDPYPLADVHRSRCVGICIRPV